MTMLTLIQNDTGPLLTGTVNADLTGATVEVHVKRPAPLAPLVKTPTITDAANGAWSISWAPGDLAVGGGRVYYVEVQATFSIGGPQTFQIDEQTGGRTCFKVADEIA